MFKKVSLNYRMASTGSDTGCLTTVVEQKFENGMTKVVHVSGSSNDLIEDLPAPDNFTLKAQLDAGVRLDYVDTKVMPASQGNSVDTINSLNKLIENETAEN